MPSRRTFRLYILGRLNAGDVQRLAVLAEFRAARAIERVKATREQLDELTREIEELRAFVEQGGTDFDQKKLSGLGERLFRLIFQGKVRDLFIRATGQEIVGMPCEILVEDHALAGWPWEYLYDRTNAKFICQEFHPITRGIFTLVPGRPLGPRKGKLQVLVVVGARSDDSAVGPQEELKAILNVFQGGTLDTGDVTFSTVPPDRPTDIIRYLQAERYDVLHYVGHAGIDSREGQGYLRFDRGDRNELRFYARDFSALLIDRGIRLVVLNGCNTARAEPGTNPANSAFATALLDRGVPAVMATQFAMPNSGALYFASLFYSALAQGRTLVEAMTDGRSSMLQANERAYFDWGIPVLFTTDPNLVVYQPRERISGAARGANVGIAGREAVGGMPAAAAQQQQPGPTTRVAIADFDATVAFLPELVRKANEVQSYYRFEFLPTYLPAGALGSALGGTVDEAQLLLYRLDAHLKDLPKQYGANEVLCLTRHRITIKEENGSLSRNLMVASPDSNSHVSVISTYKLRDYARQADVPFAKATLYLCVGALISAENFSDTEEAYHKETVGCPLDYCENPDDVVKGLKAMSFTHQRCVAHVHNPAQLQAINSLLGLTIEENYEDVLSPRRRRKRSTSEAKSRAGPDS